MTMPGPGGSGRGGSQGEGVSGAVTGALLDYVRRVAGEGAVDQVLRRSGQTRTARDLAQQTTWVPRDEAAALFDAAADATADPSVARHAGEEVLRRHAGTDAANVLRSLGSPAEVLRSVAAAVSTALPGAPLQLLHVGEGGAVVQAEDRSGRGRHIHLCEFTTGVLSQVPTIFERPPADVDEPTCQARGASACRYELTWGPLIVGGLLDTDAGSHSPPGEPATDSGDAAEASELHRQLRRVEARLRGLTASAAELLSADDPEGVLARLTAQAARAVSAPRYLLVVHLAGAAGYQLHHKGLSEEDAQTLAHRLVSPERRAGTDDARHGPDGSAMLVADVASARRHYGHVVMLRPEGDPFDEDDEPLLAVYGDYAAAVLDLIAARREARAAAAGAGAILELGRRLAAARSADDAADALAEVLPTVVGARRAVVLVADGDRLRPAAGAAVHVPASVLPTVTDLASAVGPDPTALAVDATSTDPALRGLLAAVGGTALGVATMVAAGRLVGVAVVDFGPHPDAGLHRDRELQRRMQLLAAQTCAAIDRLAELAASTSVTAQTAGGGEPGGTETLRDPVTGLPGWRLFADRVDQELRRARRHGTEVGLVVVGLDWTRPPAGPPVALPESAVARAAERLQRAVRRTQDSVARIAPDRFAVLVPEVTDDAALDQLGQRASDALVRPSATDAGERLVARVGVAIASRTAGTAASLLDAALDAAHGTSSRPGRDQMQPAEPVPAEPVPPTVVAATTGASPGRAEIERAVDNDELFVVYQPYVDLLTDAVVGLEALVRWRSPHRGVLAPDDFLPAAWDSDLIVAIDTWVLAQAARHVAAWIARGVTPPRLAVNVTARDLGSDQFLDVVARCTASWSPGEPRLELDVPEEALTGDLADTVATHVERLHRLGVGLSIDDFGTGQLPLTRVGSLPLSTIKIDPSFVRAIVPGGPPPATASAVVAMAAGLGVDCVAEGVETEHQRRVLLERGCHTAQGFLFGAPCTARDVETMLVDRGTGSR